MENIKTPQSWLDEVSKDGLSLKNFKVQTHELCLLAVKQNGLAIQYVLEKTPILCSEAVKQSIDALLFINSNEINKCMKTLKMHKDGSFYLLKFNDLQNKTEVYERYYNDNLLEGIKVKLIEKLGTSITDIIFSNFEKIIVDNTFNEYYLAKINNNKYELHKREITKLVVVGYLWNSYKDIIDDKLVMKFKLVKI